MRIRAKNADKIGMVLLTVKIHLGITANVVPEYFIVLLCVAMPRCHPVMQYWYCNAMS